MAFVALFFCGLAGGLLGGMGMGGGTALIPLLTLALGVPQGVAQGLNLVCFLPMSAAALAVHAKSGLVRREGLLPALLTSALFSVLFAMAAGMLPSSVLRKGFGVFLFVLGMRGLRKEFSRFWRGRLKKFS